MIADIDRARLSIDTHSWLTETGLSTRAAASRFPGINPAMISRACNERIISAASLLALCAVMGRDPMRYLIMLDRRVQNQTVTAFGKRETWGANP